MNLIVLENQKIPIKMSRDEKKGFISRADADLLRQVELKNPGIFKWGYDTIAPQQWVGVISAKDLNLEILPKIADDYDEKEIRNKLLYMFQVAYDIPTRNNIESRIKFGKNGIVEILIGNFLLKLEHYLQGGMIRTYEKRQGNLHAVKGAISFTQQINKNSVNPTRFYCRFSKLTEDSPINRYIKTTLLRMSKVTRELSNIELIKKMTPYFESVSLFDESMKLSNTLVFGKNNERAKELIEYCDLFLSGLSVHMTSGNAMINAVLFDMNKLFEKFIFKSLKKVYGNKVHYQISGNYLLENMNDNKRKIKLRPDVIISSNANNKIVLDTKWKAVDRFIKESDAYQMNAYCSAIPDVTSTVLLYPLTAGIRTAVGDYRINSTDSIKMLKIRAVDLKIVDNKRLFGEYLKCLIES